MIESFIGQPYYKPCMMTVFMHDYATPSEDSGFFSRFLGDISASKRPPESVMIYNNVTIELLRELSDEQIGKIIRQQLNKLEEQKAKIESK